MIAKVSYYVSQGPGEVKKMHIVEVPNNLTVEQQDSFVVKYVQEHCLRFMTYDDIDVQYIDPFREVTLKIR